MEKIKGTEHIEDTTEEIINLCSQDLSSIPSCVYSSGSTLSQLFLDYNELEELDDSLCNALHHLTTLSLVGNVLHCLPTNIGNLQRLENLYVNENEISEIPDTLCNVKTLKILNLVGNKISHLPEHFGNLESLQHIVAYENKIEYLPTTFDNLNHLLLMDFSDNKLNELPSRIDHLDKLKIINLANNNIHQLPDSFSQLEAIEELDLSLNKLSCLPETFASHKTLRKLFIETNNLMTLPDWFSDLPALEEFSAKDNHLCNKAIPELFGLTSKKCRVLEIAGNFITELPGSIGCLQEMELFHLGSVIDELERRNFQNGNWVTQLPDSFGNLRSLKKLHLEENQLNDLPQNFGDLISLEWLDLGQNKLYSLPDSFCKLKNLKICQISKNHLRMLPDEFGELSSLKELRLDNNQIEVLPSTFRQLTTLEVLDIFNNKLQELPDCLPVMSNLKRLDIDQNEFDIDPLKVPCINIRASYPERDPTQPNNWRGKSRSDIVCAAVTQLDEIPDESPGGVSGEIPEEVKYNCHAFELAARRNMSLWRSHDGPDKRSKFIHKDKSSIPLTPTWLLKHDKKDDSVEGSQSDWSSQTSEKSQLANAVADTYVEHTENWEEDVNDFVVPPVGDASLCDQDSDEFEFDVDFVEIFHRFLPAEAHSISIEKVELRQHAQKVVGQFDDCEQS